MEKIVLAHPYRNFTLFHCNANVSASLQLLNTFVCLCIETVCVDRNNQAQQAIPQLLHIVCQRMLCSTTQPLEIPIILIQLNQREWFFLKLFFSQSLKSDWKFLEIYSVLTNNCKFKLDGLSFSLKDTRPFDMTNTRKSRLGSHYRPATVRKIEANCTARVKSAPNEIAQITKCDACLATQMGVNVNSCGTIASSQVACTKAMHTKILVYIAILTIDVLTFLIDSSRFRYPERAIVFLAVCYLVVGCAYVAGLGAGDSVACREPFPPPVRLGRLQMMSTITQGHRQSTACTVLFMALYFCCMAAFAWWSCLAFAWFLAAGLKWGHEAIENKSHLFHLVAWAIPALQTISVLALAKVEGKRNIHISINLCSYVTSVRADDSQVSSVVNRSSNKSFFFGGNNDCKELSYDSKGQRTETKNLVEHIELQLQHISISVNVVHLYNVHFAFWIGQLSKTPITCDD
uniref:G-protein coupled receptors family 2 profile 2 domain-containing protein n=1 Tax=Glossina pallidipes TaxID=7398 RepID=A0A1B0A6N3_GLOPL